MLKIDDEPRSEGHRLRLAGEWDLVAAPNVDEHVDKLLRQGVCNLEIDMTDVQFIDSKALASLVSIRRKLQGDGKELRLTGLGPNLMKVFEVTGLVRYFELGAAP